MVFELSESPDKSDEGNVSKFPSSGVIPLWIIGTTTKEGGLREETDHREPYDYHSLYEIIHKLLILLRDF